MTENNTLRRHARLVDTMAETLGVDLEEQALRGNVSVDQISDAVLSCTACTQPDTCEHWLATRQGIEATAPGYCRNADLLQALKP